MTASPAATPKKTREEVNAARRAYRLAHGDRLRAHEKAVRRAKKGLPPIEAVPSTTFEQAFEALQQRFRRETGMQAVFKIEVTQVSA